MFLADDFRLKTSFKSSEYSPLDARRRRKQSRPSLFINGSPVFVLGWILFFNTADGNGKSIFFLVMIKYWRRNCSNDSVSLLHNLIKLEINVSRGKPLHSSSIRCKMISDGFWLISTVVDWKSHKPSWGRKNTKNMEWKQVEKWKDLENTEENCDKICNIRKKSRLNSEMIWKIWMKAKLNSEKIWNKMEESQVE